MEFKGVNSEYIGLFELNTDTCHLLKNRGNSELVIVWFRDNESRLIIDNVEHSFEANQLVTLTEFHKVRIGKIGAARIFKFNRAFYCILDHDDEVGCKGVLFFGASRLPVIRVDNQEVEKLDILWRMFSIEMTSRDRLQYEMLQMMLKRLIILATRMYKEQNGVEMDVAELDVVRQFNFLVETNFREKRTVKDYADMMYRSPKTLSNLFGKFSDKSPLQIIKDRIMLEARRLLSYTDKAVSEIAYDLGYDDVQSFSRFFKSQEGVSPKAYRDDRAFQEVSS